MSSGDKEQVINGDSSNNGGSRCVLVILVAIALLVGTIAVILGIVAVSNRNVNGKVYDGDVNGGNYDGDDDGDRNDYDSTAGTFRSTFHFLLLGRSHNFRSIN